LRLTKEIRDWLFRGLMFEAEADRFDRQGFESVPIQPKQNGTYFERR